jgi:hypothetical protein
MPAEIVLSLRAIAAPAALTVVLGLILLRALPARLAERLALPVAVAAGFCAGYWLLGEWGELLPKRHREWLPWLAILAATAGRSTASSYVSWFVWAVLAALSAWVLVPTWDTLWPSRLVAVPLLAAYLLLLMVLLATLPDRLVGRLFGFLLTAAGVTVGLQIAIGVSVKIGLVALAAAAALGGCAVAACLRRGESQSAESPRASASLSLIPAFAVLIGGLAFLGAIEPQEPLPIILLAPAAPLMLWFFATGPLAKLQGWQAAMLQFMAVALPLGIALAVIVAT